MKDLSTGFKNRRGSFALFAAMAFSAVLIMVMAAIKSSGDMAIGSAVRAFGSLWGKSVLGEYDVYLKERYGILAFCGNEFSVGEKLDMYMDYSFKEKEYISCEKPQCSLEGYGLAETDNLKKQIEDIILSGCKPAKKEEGEQEEPHVQRYISSPWILKSLPSCGKTEKTYILGLITKIKAGAGVKELLGKVAVDKYIFTFFKDYMDDRDLSDTYFSCEIEYIISGKPGDREAKKDAEGKIRNLRNMLNLYYLYTCPEKREGALALASAITPGPAAALTQAVIMEIWAYAEAENDMKILYDEKTVPLLKNDSNWALSLENVFNTDTDSAENLEKKAGAEEGQPRYVSPQVIRGEDYAQYLGVILCGVPEKTKLLRIMDIIQINMKYLYCGHFSMDDYHVGLKYEMKVNGGNYEFEEKYD